MRPSRGMGAIAPKKTPKSVVKRDGAEPVKLFAKGGKTAAGKEVPWFFKMRKGKGKP